MLFTSSKDTQFGDCYFDISQTEKLFGQGNFKNVRKNRNICVAKFVQENGCGLRV